MLPLEHISPHILMSVNYCGCQLAQMLRCAAPACLKNESATPHHGAHKQSLQYDRRPDWHFGVQVGIWNMGSLNGKGEVCGGLRKMMIDVCCFL